MPGIIDRNLDYDRPLKIAEGTYWVGLFDPEAGWLSSPYLIVDNGEAVLIDAGSRYDFATVIMKTVQAGVVPSSISALIYQNYNPRLWGSLDHLENLIGRNDLKIISDRANLRFMQHHSRGAALMSLDDIDHRFVLRSGRCLEFINTPFAHSAGSFTTFDRKTGVLFTGDLFSSYISRWSLLLRLEPKCRACKTIGICVDQHCRVQDILRFHQDMMSSERALKLALDRIAALPFSTIAPQHGSILDNSEDIIVLCELLASLKGVGIDAIIGDRSFFELGDTSPIRDRLHRGSTGSH
jgi:flavorubredoxin